jgi:GT2 family glycosyltransferase
MTPRKLLLRSGTRGSTGTGMVNSAQGDVVSSLTEMIGPEGTNFRVINGVYPRSGYDGTTLVPSGLMLRREVARRIGGWRDYRTITQNPDLDFVSRARLAGYRFASTGELTVFKFNSALRKNSYIDKPCHQQTAYLMRIEQERWFMLREALSIARVHFRRLPMLVPAFPPAPDSQAPGWEVSQYRKFRGLE